MKLIGIVYLRRSTGKQERSLGDQLDFAIQRARELGVHLDATVKSLRRAEQEGLCEVGGLYIDNAVSGSSTNRSGFTAFIRRGTQDGSVTHCFGWSRDRFNRTNLAYIALGLETDLLRAGCHTVFAQGITCKPRTMYGDYAGEDIQLFLEYSNAGAYLIKLAQGVLRGQGNNARNGFANGGTATYGFVRASVRAGSDELTLLADGETRRGDGFRTVHVPGEDQGSRAELDVVRRIFNWYDTGNGGFSTIASRLNAERIPSPGAGTELCVAHTKRKRPVSGEWTTSSVRGVLEQPFYAGMYVWGRRSEGKFFRYQVDAAGSAREARKDELHEDRFEGKKSYDRETANWITTTPGRQFEPIVPIEVWLRVQERVKKRGKQGGLRGVPRHSDPDKYPIRVICGECKELMCGSPYGGEPCYLCSTYSNSHGEKCLHGWVQRDVVVAYAIRAIQEKAVQASQTDALRAAIHDLFQAPPKSAASDSELEELEDEERTLHQRQRQAYRDKVNATEAAERECAAEYFDELSAKLKSVKRRLTATQRKNAVQVLDVDAEVEACLDLLGSLHERLDEIPAKSLREVFNSLGVTVTIDFEKKRVGQRQIIPTHAEVRLGANGSLVLPAATPPGEVEEKALGINGRGERIRTSDLCNPIAAR